MHGIDVVMQRIFEKWGQPDADRATLADTDDKKRAIFRIHERLMAVFRDEEAVREWLDHPHPFLGHKTPRASLADNLNFVVEMACFEADPNVCT